MGNFRAGGLSYIGRKYCSKKLIHGERKTIMIQAKLRTGGDKSSRDVENGARDEKTRLRCSEPMGRSTLKH